MLHRANMHNYQNGAADHIKENEMAGLLMEMGTGKTVTCLTAVDDLQNVELAIDNCLVVGPKRVAEHVWSSEIAEWSHLQHMTCSRIIGTPKQRKHAIQQKASIHTIGVDNLAWLIGLYGGMMLPWDMIIIDESSCFKNHKSKRWEALVNVLPSVDRVVILTGTPAPNGLKDLWAQIYLLDFGKRLGRFISHFIEDYFHTPGKGRYSKPVVSKRRRQDIYDKIADICISIRAEDYLELPPVVVNDVQVVFPPSLKAKYKEFEREQIMELLNGDGDEKEVIASNGAALSNKLLQFANGAVYSSPFGVDPETLEKEEVEVLHVHDLKLDALEEIIIAAQGNPVLVAYSYRHDLHRILDRLRKYGVRTLDGNETIDAWNRGEIPVLAMHPASGGHGLNMQKGGNRVVWFGQTWNLEHYLQLNARLARQGQKNRVFIDRLVAPGTLDVRVVKALSGKEETQDSMMDAVKALINEYKN